MVPTGNPDGVEGLGDLVDRDLGFVNRSPDAGLRSSLDAAVDELAAERDATRSELTDAIRGFAVGTKGFESPARAVARGDADAGVSLRATAESLGLGFVPVDTESVRVRASPDRVEKPGVEELAAGLDDLDAVTDGLAGYNPD